MAIVIIHGILKRCCTVLEKDKRGVLYCVMPFDSPARFVVDQSEPAAQTDAHECCAVTN